MACQLASSIGRTLHSWHLFLPAKRTTTKNGELWAFDADRYVREGTKQWKKWKKTTRGGTGRGEHFDPRLTMFAVHEPPNWFVCQFYPTGFPRQNAQSGFYSLTARFGVDHAPRNSATINRKPLLPPLYHPRRAESRNCGSYFAINTVSGAGSSILTLPEPPRLLDGLYTSNPLRPHRRGGEVSRPAEALRIDH